MRRVLLGLGCLTFFLLSANASATAAPDTTAPGSTLSPVTATDTAVAGKFYWDELAVDYRGGVGEDGKTVTSTIVGADGKTLAESVVTPDLVKVTVAGVEITSEKEITEDEAKILADFAQSEEAAAIRALATALAGSAEVEKRTKLLGFTTAAIILGEGPGAPQFAVARDCFGCCGPGCWGCYLLGRCYTLACAVHDGCVDLLGHLHPACLKLLLVATRSCFRERLHVPL